MGLVIRGKVAHQLALRVMQPGLLFKSGIHLQETIIDGAVLGVKDHLDDAKPFDHRVEQRAISLFRPS